MQSKEAVMLIKEPSLHGLIAFSLLMKIAREGKRPNQPMKVRKKERTESDAIGLPRKDLRSPSKH